MPRPKKVVDSSDQPKPVQQQEISQLIDALVQAINLTKPEVKKNAINRKIGSPWSPKDGSPKLKLKRKHYQHAIPIDPDLLSNQEIDLLNRLKVGNFMNGWVKVYRRKDHGIDIDYPLKTASHKLKLVSSFGIRSFSDLLQRCIDESSNPATYVIPDED